MVGGKPETVYFPHPLSRSHSVPINGTRRSVHNGADERAVQLLEHPGFCAKG